MKWISFVAILVVTIAAQVSSGGAPSNVGLGLRDLFDGKNGTDVSYFVSTHSTSDGTRRVAVNVILDGTVSIAKVEAAMADTGSVFIASVPDYRHGIVSAYASANEIAAIAALPGIISVVSAEGYIRSLFLSPAIATLNISSARSNGVSGRGITIGILSDSYNKASISQSATDDIIEGWLPGPNNPDGFSDPVIIVDDTVPSSYDPTDEGRAMIQLIHMIAPRAKKCFATAYPSEANFANNILRLAQPPCNADIIVDDVGYFAEPIFEPGIIGAAINTVTANGVAYFSAAGNNNGESVVQTANWETPTNFRTTLPKCNRAHRFSTTGLQYHILDPNSSARRASQIYLRLHWDQPYYKTDYSYGQHDVHVWELIGSSVRLIQQSTDVISATKIPLQMIRIFPSSLASSSSRILVTVCYGGTGVPATQLVISQPNSGVAIFQTEPPQSTLSGHGLARGCMTIGAMDCQTGLRESFSSSGPSLLKFDSNGNSINAPECKSLDQKPDFMGCDNVQISFPLGGGSNFFFKGTSAAAPNVAAVAALMLEQAGGPRSKRPDELREILARTARQRFYSSTNGYGTINGDLAISNLALVSPASPPVPPTNLIARTIGSNKANLTWTSKCDGGAVIQSYALTISKNNASTVINTGSASNQYQISVATGDVITVSVAAQNALGTSGGGQGATTTLTVSAEENVQVGGLKGSTAIAVLVAIGVGGLLLLLCIGCLIYRCCCRSRRLVRSDVVTAPPYVLPTQADPSKIGIAQVSGQPYAGPPIAGYGQQPVSLYPSQTPYGQPQPVQYVYPSSQYGPPPTAIVTR